MNLKLWTSVLGTAQIHVVRLNFAMKKLKGKLPMTAEKVKTLKNNDILLWELLTNRFAKLQDLIGNKLFNLFLEASGENIENWTMIDKVNKLEKLEIIENSNFWTSLRLLRNHLAHEYPEHPEITAKYLNQTVTAVPELIRCLEKLIDGYQRL